MPTDLVFFSQAADGTLADGVKLSVRTASRLWANDILSAAEAHDAGLEGRLLTIRGFGSRCLNELAELLYSQGFDRSWHAATRAKERDRRLAVARKSAPAIGRSVWLTLEELETLNREYLPDSALEKFKAAYLKALPRDSSPT